MMEIMSHTRVAVKMGSYMHMCVVRIILTYMLVAYVHYNITLYVTTYIRFKNCKDNYNRTWA